MKEQFININGLKIFTRIAGDGSPFLILHGWGASSESWINVQEKLSEKYRVFSLDFPGFGKSDLPPRAWAVQDYVQLILDFSQKIGLEKFYLLGHSFGGRVSIKLSAQFPQKVKKLILVDAAGIKVYRGLKKRLARVMASFFSLFKIVPGFSTGRKVFYRFVLRETDYLKTEGVMKETFKNIIEEDLVPFLKEISTPTLIIWGKEDKVTPLRDAYLMNKEIKDSKLELLECAHSPHLEKPAFLAKTILNFLEKNES